MALNCKLIKEELAFGEDKSEVLAQLDISPSTDEDYEEVIYKDKGLYVHVYGSGVATLMQISAGDESNSIMIASATLSSKEPVSFLSALDIVNEDGVLALICGDEPKEN